MPKGKEQEDPDFQVEPTVDEGLLAEFQDQDAPDPGDEEVEEGTEEEHEEEEGGEEGPEDGLEEEPEKPEPKKYKLKGKEYTLEELQAQGLLEDIVTQSEQVSHYQALYHDAKERVDAITQQQQQHAQQLQQRAQQAEFTPDQIRGAMQPFLARAVQNGYMEQEYVEEFPAAAAVQMHVFNDFMQVKQVVMGMYQYFMRQQSEQMYQRVKGTFDSACQALTTKHPVYANLAKPEDREKFFEYLSTKVNPEASAINEEFLGQTYLAYQQANILSSIQKGSDQRQGKRKKQRKLAAGEGSPAPRKGGQSPKLSDDDAVIAGMMEHFYKNH